MVASAVEEQSVATAEISLASGMAATSTTTVNDGIAAILRETATSGGMAETVSTTAEELGSEIHDLKSRLTRILAQAQSDNTATNGGVTADEADKPFIAIVQEGAARAAQALEAAVERGDISLEDMFDGDYRPIIGSNPPQHTTRFCQLTDRLFPEIQEPLLQRSERIVFAAAVDRNGYLPTHNQKYAQPQGADPEWNNANSRNRRIFDDPTGKAAGANTEPYLLQTYVRNLGGNEVMMMRDLSVPIYVKGRHWGGFRLGYYL